MAKSSARRVSQRSPTTYTINLDDGTEVGREEALRGARQLMNNPLHEAVLRAARHFTRIPLHEEALRGARQLMHNPLHGVTTAIMRGLAVREPRLPATAAESVPEARDLQGDRVGVGEPPPPATAAERARWPTIAELKKAIHYSTRHTRRILKSAGIKASLGGAASKRRFSPNEVDRAIAAGPTVTSKTAEDYERAWRKWGNPVASKRQ